MIWQAAPARLSAVRRRNVFRAFFVVGARRADGYRARDPKLRRDIALKVLPAAFSSEPDRLEFFEREAQLLASLNHSHIAGLAGARSWGFEPPFGTIL